MQQEQNSDDNKSSETEDKEEYEASQFNDDD